MTAAVEVPTRTREVPAGTPHNPHHTRRWAILAILAVAQLVFGAFLFLTYYLQG